MRQKLLVKCMYNAFKVGMNESQQLIYTGLSIPSDFSYLNDKQKEWFENGFYKFINALVKCLERLLVKESM